MEGVHRDEEGGSLVQYYGTSTHTQHGLSMDVYAHVSRRNAHERN